ncbi:hypothetical protein [Parapedobacter sp. DT-150]|uniref:hypothetical protein n=1 Tax=Parapedobacter sp. DT-150 TaxID=3396162 RepID=UPI003F1B6162
MKKLMLLMLGSAILATSAVAKEPQTQTATKPEQTALSNEPNKKSDAVLANGTLGGISQLNNDVYIQAYNTSTGQTYYLTAPTMSSASISLPTGTYDISVSTSNVFADIYISDDDDSYNVDDVYYHTFSNITINNSYATVVAVYYP